MEQQQHPILTTNYFQKVLQDYFKLKNPPNIDSLNISACSEAGFLSVLKRVSIQFQNTETKAVSEISLIVKSETKNEFSAQKIGKDGIDVQSKEMNFYGKIAPKMMEIFDDKIFPKVLKIDDENQTLILEDLSRLNFRGADQMLGLNEQHVKMSLEKIAKFHAASIKIAEENPGIYQDFEIGMFSSKFDTFDRVVSMLFAAAVDEILTWTEFEEFGLKLSKIQEKSVDRLKKCFAVDRNELNVLNHGDLWTTNFMFAYDLKSGHLDDAILIDFQFPHYGSPALDLIRYFFTSFCDDLYNPNDIQRLLLFYFDELSSNVKNFKCQIQNFPTFEEFLDIFNKKLHFALMFTLSAFPIMTSDDPDNDFVAHISVDKRSNDFRRRVMKAERFQKTVRKILPFYDSMGLLD